ncbi:hypothetical protein BMJ29_33010 [Sinorhizobium medicae]|nr:hypothetical protein BMJ29_33010 [Sinorhizobium medicae]
MRMSPALWVISALWLGASGTPSRSARHFGNNMATSLKIGWLNFADGRGPNEEESCFVGDFCAVAWCLRNGALSGAGA